MPKPSRPLLGAALCLALCGALALPARAPAADIREESVKPSIPDVSLVDQDGKPVRFYSDLVQGKVVMMNFVFTSCTTICPPLGATFAKVRTLLGDRAGKDVHLISVSIDPATDTPERLKAWSQKLGGGPGWTLVTGDKDSVTRLLKGLGVYTASTADHSPLVLVGNDAQGRWTRAYGLAPPTKLIELIGGVSEAPKTAAESPAQHYFGEIPLVDQDGRTLRLYSDLLKGRVVVIDAMFTSCTGACPLMGDNLAKLQDWLGDRLGKDIYLLSFSVDPGNDTPARLKEYAARLKARPGWLFLTGTQENVDAALTKLGQHAETRDAHSNLFLIGNDKTGLWKKAFGLAKPADLIPIVESVLNDKG
jgi:protein SCO1/2